MFRLLLAMVIKLMIHENFVPMAEILKLSGDFSLPLNGGVEQGSGCFYVRMMISHTSVSF